MKDLIYAVSVVYFCLHSISLSAEFKDLYVRISNKSSGRGLSCFDEFKNLCRNALEAVGYNITPCEPCDDNSTDINNHKRALKSSKNFETLLNRTVINVLLLEDNKDRCMESYNRWLCFTQYKFYNDSECTASCKCKPSIAVCNKVVQNCPYYTPSRYQSDTPSNENDTCEDTRDKTEDEKREVIYGGLPAFLCPSKDNKNRDMKYEYDVEKDDDRFACNCTM